MNKTEIQKMILEIQKIKEEQTKEFELYGEKTPEMKPFLKDLLKSILNELDLEIEKYKKMLDN